MAPPAGGERHWKDGRSAKELAKAWLGSGRVVVPGELRTLLESNPAVKDLVIATAIPEQRTYFADGARGPRHHDLVLYGYAADRRTVVGIEAKADEGLDQPIESRVREAFRRRRRGEPTSFPERLDRFALALFGFRGFPEPRVLDPRLSRLPYQLVSGLAGTIREAALHRADQAVFAVHVLESDELDAALLEQNARGLRLLRELMAGREELVRDAVLVGPLAFLGSAELPPLPLFIGSVRTRLSTRASG